MRLEKPTDSIIVLELLRQMVDELGVPFEEAVPIVQGRFAAPEGDTAWECYSFDDFKSKMPRLYQLMRLVHKEIVE